MYTLGGVDTEMKKYGLRLFLGLIGIVILFVGVFYAFVELTPFNTAKLDAKSPATEVLDKNGSVYMTIGGEGTTNLSYAQLPKNLANALVATEEHNYWTSSSVDVKGVFRSVFVDLLSRSYAQGASTIEMQLAKIVYLNDKKTLFRKFEQVVLGVQINRYYTKQEILAMYLNKVYLGEGTVGVEQAAKRFFGVDLAQNKDALTLPQAALLAGLPQAPSGYDPFTNPSSALKRRNQVLDNMAKYGYITASAAAAAKQAPLGVSRHTLSGDAWDVHPLFTEFLFDYANKQGISQEAILHGGLKIYTTLDPKVQSAVDTVFWSHNYNGDFPSFSKDTVLQGAALFVDPKTGGILGGAGSRKDGFVPGGLDRIYHGGSPGSSIKPIMDYAPAIESGKFGPGSILNNTPHDFGGGYTPQNYDRASAPGQCSLAYALQTSQNVASVSLLQQIGLSTGTSFAQNDGIPISDANRNQLGIAIGGGLNVSPYIMAQAYEAFDNQGVQMQEHLITKMVNMQGETIYSYQAAAKRIMSPGTAATMTQLLANVVNQGTGTNAQVPGWQVAGKTGTVEYGSGESHSNWLSRVWFDGYTGNMVGSVTLGYDTTDASHHLVDFPDPVANCAKVFSDMVTLAEQGVQPVPLNASSAAATTAQQVQNVPIAGLNASYNAGLNSVTLHWTSKTTSQQLAFIVSRTTISLPAAGGSPDGTSGAGNAGGGDGAGGSTGDGTSGSTGAGTGGSAGGGTGDSAGGNTGSQAQGTTGVTQVVGKVSGTSFLDPNVQPGATYQYSVQPIDASSQKPVAQPATVQVLIPGGTPLQGNTSQNPGQNTTGNGTAPDGTGAGIENTTNGTTVPTGTDQQSLTQTPPDGGKGKHHKGH
jgi:penicillin-binding protein 2A